MQSRSFLILLVASSLLADSTSASEIVFDSRGFEDEAADQPPEDWSAFHSRSRPNVKVTPIGANGSRQCVRGVRSNSGGFTALSREFAPQQRVMIEFSFAFSETAGRSLNLWSHEPGGRDASQLNLCIQNGALMQYDGREGAWDTITHDILPSPGPEEPVWHRLRAIIASDHDGIDYWVSKPGEHALPTTPITRRTYRTNLPIGAIDFVSGTRIAPQAWYRIDDLVITGGDDLPMPHPVDPPLETFRLWTGPTLPERAEEIPNARGMRHQTIHRATPEGHKFLHGAAIVHHNGVMYANWANSPVNENGPHETLQGSRSTDGGLTWPEIETIGPGFEGPERHSHGVLFLHHDEVWTIGARFGGGVDGRRFPGLQGEAFVLNVETDRWESRGVVMKNCWPYDEPVMMANGNRITGGQDKHGLPVVAISHGDDLMHWDTVSIPYDRRLKPSYAETTVWAEGERVTAIIRGGGGVAWVSVSEDSGRTWTTALPSNLPMPRSKAYLGKLSNGQLYLLSNFNDRDTLVVSVSEPGESTLSRMYRIRHGQSGPPRYPGKAKSKQWSYPYGYEHDGQLFVVYSIGKEDCGLSVIPIASLSRLNE